MKNVYIFIGTTAELIKVAPVIREFKKDKKKFKLVATGQNDINFSEFEWYYGKVKPDMTFGYKSKKSSIIYFCFWAVRTFVNAIYKLDRDFENLDRSRTVLIVHGDTVSSLIGAIVGKLLSVKVAHIESGLRSFNFLEPFPEEISRVIISQLADIHFCPNSWAMDNLKDVSGKKVNTKRNTLYDVYKSAIGQKSYKSLKRKVREKYYVLIMHRQEHVLFDKRNSLELLSFIVKNSKLKCVLLTHEISKNMMKKMKVNQKKIMEVNRMPYLEFINLLNNSEFVVTDGGSNQEELYYMGKPTLLLRKRTERTEGLGENAILSYLSKKTSLKFLHSYDNLKRKAVKDYSESSKTIVNNLIK